MQNGPVNWSRLLRDLLFHVTVVGTLIIVAAFFATRPEYTQIHYSYAYNSDINSSNEIKEKLLGISSEGWTAIFTGVLALFTLALVMVSSVQIYFLTRADETGRIAADAANLNARAAVGAELPIVFAGTFVVGPAKGSPFSVIGQLPSVPIVSLKFHNYGRTPAEMIGYCIVIKIAEKLPDPRVEPEIFPVAPGTIIKPDGSLPFTYVFQWSEPEQRAIFEGETRLWFYGRMAYMDFLGNRHEIGFCSMALPWENNVLKFVFSSETPSGYVYRKSC